MTNKQRCQKAAMAPACLETPANGLRTAAGSMREAAYIMDQLHGLLVAIRKLNGQDAQHLARIGEGLTAEWYDRLDKSALAAEWCSQHDAASPPAEPAYPLPSRHAAPAEPRAVLPMDAYDAATLHLEKAETLAEMLCVLGPDGVYELTPDSIAGAFLTLQGELIEIRAALNQRVPKGDK